MKGNFEAILKGITGTSSTVTELRKEVNFLNQFKRFCEPTADELEEQLAKVNVSVANVSAELRAARIDEILFKTTTGNGGEAVAPKSVAMWKEFIENPHYTGCAIREDKKSKGYVLKDTIGRLSYEALNDRYREVIRGEKEKAGEIVDDKEITLAQNTSFDSNCESFYRDCYRRTVTDNLDKGSFDFTGEPATHKVRSMNELVKDCRALIDALLPAELAEKIIFEKKEIRVFGLAMTKATKDVISLKGSGWGNYWLFNAIKIKLNGGKFIAEYGKASA